MLWKPNRWQVNITDALVQLEITLLDAQLFIDLFFSGYKLSILWSLDGLSKPTGVFETNV